MWFLSSKIMPDMYISTFLSLYSRSLSSTSSLDRFTSVFNYLVVYIDCVSYLLLFSRTYHVELSAEYTNLYQYMRMCGHAEKLCINSSYALSLIYASLIFLLQFVRLTILLFLVALYLVDLRSAFLASWSYIRIYVYAFIAR